MRNVDYGYVIVDALLRDLPEMVRDARLLELVAVNSAAFPSGKGGFVRGGVRLGQQERFLGMPDRRFAEDIMAAVGRVTSAIGELPKEDAEVLRAVCFRRTSSEDAAEALGFSLRRIHRVKKRCYKKLFGCAEDVLPTVKRWRAWREAQCEAFIRGGF